MSGVRKFRRAIRVQRSGIDLNADVNAQIAVNAGAGDRSSAAHASQQAPTVQSNERTRHDEEDAR
jgi:hypothetical protein